MKTFYFVLILMIISSCDNNPADPENFKWISLDETATVNETASLSIEAVNNPMPSTIIMYSIPDSANAKLTISNSYNTVISTLMNGELQSGVYSVQLNYNSLREGVYFYRLQIQAAKYSEDIVKKMLLIK